LAVRDGPAVGLTAYWPTSPANTGDFGATLRREAVSSRIRANLKSARLLSALAEAWFSDDGPKKKLSQLCNYFRLDES
jgi:hypothetical protein